jgi:hypothetical protein
MALAAFWSLMESTALFEKEDLTVVVGREKRFH